MWVDAREFEDQLDYWDGDWVRVVVRCEAEGSCVEVSGAIIHLPDLERWLEQLQVCNRDLNGVARLGCIEPNLSGLLTMQAGSGELVINITPDQLAQEHRFTFQVDQSHFPELIAGLEKTLKRFPIRGKP